MALGVKVKTVKTKNAYTIEGFYEAIKDVNFSAGQPMLTKHGPSTVIVFPPQNQLNQVWILRNSFSKESKKFVVQKGEQAGFKSGATNLLANELTQGYSNLLRTVGNSPKETERLVEATAKELDALHL